MKPTLLMIIIEALVCLALVYITFFTPNQIPHWFGGVAAIGWGLYCISNIGLYIKEK